MGVCSHSFILQVFISTVLYAESLNIKSPLQESKIFVSNLNYTGYGTIIGNLTPNSKTSKMTHVDDKLKQRVLIQFFRAENISDEEIQTRLSFRFHDKTIDIRTPETNKEAEKRRHLHYNVVERVIIEFLCAEGVKPYRIYKRLRRVSSYGQHWCNVYRWAHRFRRGRTDVANIAFTNSMTKGTRSLRVRKHRKYTGNMDKMYARM